MGTIRGPYSMKSIRYSKDKYSNNYHFQQLILFKVQRRYGAGCRGEEDEAAGRAVAEEMGPQGEQGSPLVLYKIK